MSWRNRSPKTLAHRWPLNGHAQDVIRGQDGTPVNAPTWATNQFGKTCIELNGINQRVNLSDVTALNAVEKFTLAFWMSQDVLDVQDIIFYKFLDATNELLILTQASGVLRFDLTNGGTQYGEFDYSTVISASSWHHVACVFDGTQIGNANRLIVYVDGSPITLAFFGTIQATTADLSGQDAVIGWTGNSFDGKLSDFQLFSVALSRDEVNDVMRGHG